MILTPERRIVRFGLGSSGQPVSPIWRLWVQGDETYLAVRTASGISKVSLHSGGSWVLTAGTSTIHIRGPRGVGESWRAGPRVVFPGVAPIHPLAGAAEPIGRPTFLFHPPPAEFWRDFAILFGPRQAEQDALTALLPPQSAVIGPLVHRHGDSVWLATFVTPMTNDEVQYVRAERAKFRLHVRREVDRFRSAMAVLVTDASNGDTTLLSLDLGRENVIIVATSSD